MGSGGTPLGSVVEAREAAHSADEALRSAVERARAAGHTWQEIGEILGTSRQAAFQRFGRPVEPRTEAATGAVDRAVTVIADLVAGRWADVRRDFDGPMSTELTADKLAAVWAQVAGTIGRYERMGEPFVVQVGDHTVVTVLLHCEAGEVNARVAINRDGTVGGLFLLPA